MSAKILKQVLKSIPYTQIIDSRRAITTVDQLTLGKIIFTYNLLSQSIAPMVVCTSPIGDQPYRFICVLIDDVTQAGSPDFFVPIPSVRFLCDIGIDPYKTGEMNLSVRAYPSLYEVSPEILREFVNCL